MVHLTSLHILILAAGEGKRMRSRRPKVLLPVAGKPMLSHVLETARALHPGGIRVVFGHRGDQLQAAYRDATDIAWVHQASQRGTGHAVGLALDGLPDDARVLVLYGDVPLLTAATLAPMAAGTGLQVLTATLDNPHGYGRVVVDANGLVSAIVEERDADASTRAIRVVNTGVIACGVGALRAWLARITPNNAQGELYLTDVFGLAAASGAGATTVACADPSEAFGANDPLQLAELERLYQRRAVAALCRDGVRVSDAARVDVRGSVLVGSDVSLDIDVILEGDVSLGDDVAIGPFSRVRNSTLAAGTEVLAHCDLDGVVTLGPCRIGPYARLRPGTVLDAGAHIGNFVETKQARFGAGSKANHLSYVGDASIGAQVNIGAGTITCNYDGVNKHQTQIGDGAFIGSNSSLVAPVTVGAGATIGAGSVIAKEAPANELTVARAKQATIKGWKRPAKL